MSSQESAWRGWAAAWCLILAVAALSTPAIAASTETLKTQIEKKKEDLIDHLARAGKPELTKPIQEEAFKIMAEWQELLKQSPALKDSWKRDMNRGEQIKALRAKRAAIEASHAAELAELKKQDDAARTALDDLFKDPRLEELDRQRRELDSKIRPEPPKEPDPPEKAREQEEFKAKRKEVSRQYQEMFDVVRLSDKMREAGRRQVAATKAYQAAVSALPGVAELDKEILAVINQRHDSKKKPGPDAEARNLIKKFDERLSKLSEDAKTAGVRNPDDVRISVEHLLGLLMQLELASGIPPAP